MAVFRVERTRDYTVMCNHHLKDSNLSLKAKGLLSMMLSLPDEWNYTTRGLAAICKEGVDAIGKTLKELELAGYIIRRQLRGKDGRISDTEYTIFEKPRKPSPPDTTLPDTENPYLDNPDTEAPDTDNPAQLNTKKSNLLDGFGRGGTPGKEEICAGAAQKPTGPRTSTQNSAQKERGKGALI